MLLKFFKHPVFRNQTLIAWTVFFIFLLISLRFFFIKNFDSVGHNWDWGFPALSYMFERIRDLSAYTWSTVGLGRSSSNLQAHIPVNEVVSLLGSWFGVKGAIFIIFILIFTIAFLSFKNLLDYLGKQKKTSNYLFSALYTFSPFLFNEIIGGSWYMWVSYAFAPILFFNLTKYVHTREVKNLIGYLFAASLTIISLQNFASIELVAVLFLSGSVFIAKASHSHVRYQIKNYVWAHILFILVNLYWIIPFVDSWNVFYSMVTATAFTGGFEGVRTITQNILHIFLLTGYLDRNMYFFALPYFLSILFIFIVIFFWLATFLVFIFKNRENLHDLKKDVLVWSGILVLLSLLVKGGNAPFESLTMYIFTNFPLMSLYRSPQHLMFIVAFIVPILMCFVFQYYVAWGISKKVAMSIGVCIVIFWTGAWWYTGDLGGEMLREKNKDHIDFYSLSPEMKQVYELNETSALVHRILFLPTSFSPLFVANDYQKKAQGGQPEYTHLKNPTFNWEFNDIAKKIDDKFCYQEDFNFLNYLSLTNTRYVFLRDDVYPHHSQCGVLKIWNIDKVKENVKNIPGLIPVDMIRDLYKVDDEYFLQHIFIPKKILITNKEVEQLPEIVSDNYRIGTGIFFEKQNMGKVSVLEKIGKLYSEDGERSEVVRFKKINPTEYRVVIENVKVAFPLIFSESFHSGWRIYPKKNEDPSKKLAFISNNIHGSIQDDNLQSGRFWETWFEKSQVSELSHLLVNGYANAWLIDPNDLCIKNPEYCVKNTDGTYDIVLVLEFWPQRLIYFGGIISVAFFSAYLFIIYTNNKFQRKQLKDRGNSY